MTNPKTTIAGYLLIISSIATFLANFLTTGTISMPDLTSLLGAIGGVGLVVSKDGGH